MKTFGVINLESLPSLLLNDFCVIGVKESCIQAITYAFGKIESHERINHLVLIEPTTHLDSTFLTQLHTLATYGCKIYSYFKESEGMILQNYKIFSQFSLVILSKR